MYSSVVGEIKGYVASIEGLNGESRRMGSARGEVRNSAVDGDRRVYEG